MELEVHSRNTELDESTQEYIERRISFALDRFTSRVNRVLVRLHDLNGPRGGVDKRCTVEAHLVPSGAVLVKAAGEDIEQAVGRAASRISRRVRNELDRWRTMQRKTQDVPLPAE